MFSIKLCCNKFKSWKKSLITNTDVVIVDDASNDFTKFLSFSEKVYLPENNFIKTEICDIITSKCFIIKKFKENAIHQHKN